MAIKKLNYFGKLFVSEDGNAIIETQNSNRFIIDDISDLTTIEAKDLLIGSKNDDDDEEFPTILRKYKAKK